MIAKAGQDCVAAVLNAFFIYGYLTGEPSRTLLAYPRKSLLLYVSPQKRTKGGSIHRLLRFTLPESRF